MCTCALQAGRDFTFRNSQKAVEAKTRARKISREQGDVAGSLGKVPSCIMSVGSSMVNPWKKSPGAAGGALGVGILARRNGAMGRRG